MSFNWSGLNCDQLIVLLRPGRCFATVTVRRLTRDEGRRLALRLCSGDAAQAEHVLMAAVGADPRSVSTAEIYQSYRQEQARSTNLACPAVSQGRSQRALAS